METQTTKKIRRFVTPEQEDNIRRNKEAMKRERIRIAIRMMAHNEPEEKITLYTRFSSEELKEIRENMMVGCDDEQECKSKAMRQGLTFQDPPKGVKSPWQHL